MNKAQTSFEYIMILGGVLVIVVLASLLINTVSGAGNIEAKKNACVNALVTLSETPAYPFEELNLETYSTCYRKIGEDITWDSNGFITSGTYTDGTLAGQTFDYLPDACRNLPVPPASSIPSCGTAATNNFLFVGFDPLTATAWCCGPQPFATPTP
ncbi:MAG: class III signal peptide-containing protein [Candidatus Micrarchaeota archaeon]